MSEGESQNIQDLAQLQSLEQELIEKLQNPAIPDAEKTQIITKIGELTQLRIQLYGMLHRLDVDSQTVADQSTQVVQQQLRAVKIVEKELNHSKEELQKIQNERLGKLRVIQINNYYSKMYQAHARILKWVIGWVIILIICYRFYNRFTMVLAVLLSIYFVSKIAYLVLDTSQRSTQNFDQYDWEFNPNTAPSAPSVSDSLAQTAASTNSKCTLF
jgi:hypothetical protein